MANALLYGFYQLKDVANQRAIQVRSDILRTAIIASVAEHNQVVNNLIGLFAQPTTDYKIRFRSPTNGRLQAGDENSRALPFKGNTYDVAFPIQKGDGAWGSNYITRQKMTVQNVNDAVSDVLTADVNWVRDHILAGLFYNGAGWTSPDPEFGDLTILGLANGDTTSYVKMGGPPAADTHYYAQAAAIADATNPYPAAPARWRCGRIRSPSSRASFAPMTGTTTRTTKSNISVAPASGRGTASAPWLG
jgi:hypothetical protein